MLGEKMKLYKVLAVLTVWVVACVDHAPTDPRTFHCETLDNGLNILVIKDPKATESAAAMYVDVGVKHDPIGREGLAHFLEHMLFISNEEYTDVDALMNYTSTHGGITNAATGEDRTQYYFSVKPEYFSEGFNIFSSFFISPLFDEAYVDRERHAVNAEFIRSKENDNWRLYQLQKVTGSIHCANRFGVGNLDTLHMDGLSKDLVDFYHHHYSSDNMYFVAVTPEDIDNILPMIKTRLLSIESRKIENHRIDENRFLKKDLGRFLQVVPINDINALNISFVIPSQLQDYLKHSGHYISALVGDEAKGSIIDVLRKEDLATALSAGVEEMSELEAVFNVGIELTEKGLANMDDVISAVMSYINLVIKDGVELSRFHELQRVSSLHYLYYDQMPVVTQVRLLAGSMRDYPSSKWNNHHYILEDSKFDPSHVQLLLSHLTLDNALVILQSKQVEFDRKEPIYEIDYSISDITNAQYERWNKISDFEFSLPKKNEFIPTSIEILDLGDSDVPIQLAPQTWYKRGKFDKPLQSIAYARILEASSSDDVAFLMLWSRIFEQEKLRNLYPAMKAGSVIMSTYDHQGITLIVSGMGNQQSSVLSNAIDLLLGLDKVSSLQFNQVKHDLMQDLLNFKNIDSTALLHYKLRTLTEPMVYDANVLIEKLEAIDLESFIESINVFSAKSLEERFYYGNINPDKVKRLEQPINVHYNPIKITEEKSYFLDTERSDHGGMIFYQMPEDTDRDHLMAQLISNMLDMSMFEKLRTEEQMGYVVAMRYRNLNQWPGLACFVQSPHIPAKKIINRLEHFLHKEASFDKRVFEIVKASLLAEIRKPFKTMDQEFSFYWDQIYSGRFNYTKKAHLLFELQNINYDELKQYFQQMLDDSRRINLLTK